MFSVFRRRPQAERKFTWKPAVDAYNPYLIASLLTFYNR
ncbi:hypothetical protein OHA_1_01985 [Pleomorphomonas sp. SM30]|uniref:Uncharacterized protein n=1 Tax=Oharaeibacter diazotrophicus TaxID=1920512 RepID=A0A4R6RBU8_9HYPH|nr:hypothetical protein EDD54_3524 [Oharaeibacter diazotrophicus]BBE72395.1 hypothetical protein OHA_1_01985 [Pleomorphomonas sp. SM30]